MNKSVPWDGFRVLLAVADRGSFSAGARTLGISQPTAGRHVEALEQALGARLLVRRARGVVPTQAGEEVLAEARRMADGASAAQRRAAGGASDASTVVRISATEGLAALWLPHRLGPFFRTVKGLRVELVVDNVAVDLAARQADIAVRLFRPKEPDLVARKVAHLGFGLFASPAYLAARGKPRSVAEIARHDHIGFVERGPLPGYLRWLRGLVPQARFVVSASSLHPMFEAARAGLGIVTGTIALLSRDPNLVRILPRARPPGVDVWLTVHGDVRRNPAVAAVYDGLTELFLREARALEGGA
jgi:DNA-binding transcriptional LysR family regulator